jgi:hypothetical protein
MGWRGDVGSHPEHSRPGADARRDAHRAPLDAARSASIVQRLARGDYRTAWMADLVARRIVLSGDL